MGRLMTGAHIEFQKLSSYFNIITLTAVLIERCFTRMLNKMHEKDEFTWNTINVRCILSFEETG